MAHENTHSTAFLSTRPGLLLGATFSCLLWGSAFPCIKIANRLFGVASGDVPSQLLLAGVRFFLAGLLVLAFLWARRGTLPRPTAADLRPLLLMSVFQTSLHYGLFYPGVAHTTGSAASVVNGTSVFVTILCAALVFGQERITGRKLAACPLGFAAILVMNLSGLASGGITSEHMLGNALVLAATTSEAVAVCLIKRYSSHDLVMLSGCQFAVGGLTLAAIGLAAGGSIHPSGPEAFALLGYMGFISAGAFSVWSLLIGANPVSRVAVFSFLTPVFGVLLSTLLLDETQGGSLPTTLLALALVCAGIVIVNRASPADHDTSSGRH